MKTNRVKDSRAKDKRGTEWKWYIQQLFSARQTEENLAYC